MPPHPMEGIGSEGGLQGLPRSGGRPQSRRPELYRVRPSTAGRATTGPMVRYKRMTCLKPLYLQLNSRSPDGVGRSRCEPVGLLCCLLVNARRAFVCGSSFLVRTPEPQGVKRCTYGSKVDRRNTGTIIVRLLRSRLSAETGDGRWWGGACVVVRGRESRPHGEGGQEVGGLS